MRTIIFVGKILSFFVRSRGNKKSLRNNPTLWCAVAVALLAPATRPAKAEDPKPLTVKQCMEALAGLNSLNFVGQSNPLQPPPPDAKPYKFGPPPQGQLPIRFTIAEDIRAMTGVQIDAQKGQQDFERSLGPPPKATADHGVADEMNDRTKKLNENWQATLDGPCSVKPGHLRVSDLKIGDGDGDNPIPPGVLSVLLPIIDR